MDVTVKGAGKSKPRSLDKHKLIIFLGPKDLVVDKNHT